MKSILKFIECEDRGMFREMLQDTICQSEGDRKLIHDIQNIDPQFIRIISNELAKTNHLNLARKSLKLVLDSGAAVTEDWFVYASWLMHFRGLATRSEHYVEALNVFRKMSVLSPANILAWVNIGLYWLDSFEDPAGWRNEAVSALKQAISLDRNCLLALYALGIVYESYGRRHEAVEIYFEILRIDPTHSAARLRLAWADSEKILSKKQRNLIEISEQKDIGLDDIVVEKSSGPARAREIYLKYGLVIIRGMLDKSQLGQICQNSMANLKKRNEVDGSSIWRMEEIDAGLRSRVRTLLNDEGLSEYLKTMLTFEQSGWNQVEDDAWHIQYRGERDILPAPVHQDHPVLSNHSDFLTCWFSAEDCGCNSTPGLKLYTEYFKHPIHMSEQFPEAPANIPMDFLREYLSEKSITPEMGAGDMLIFGPKMFHETEVLDNPKKYRLSYDVRFKAGPSAWGFKHS